MRNLIDILNEYNRLGIREQLDYEKFYLYSIIANSTALENSRMTEADVRSLFEKGKPQLHAQHLQMDIDQYILSTGEKMVDKQQLKDELAEKTREKSKETREKTREKIVKTIGQNPLITTNELSEMLGITVKGVEWQLKQLKSQGIIRRVGADRGGYWEVVSDNQ